MKPSVARLWRPAALVGALVLAAAPSLAQTPPAGEPAPGRYQFQPVEGGLARLDTATGEITICRIDPATLACDMEPAAAGAASPRASSATAPSVEGRAEAAEDEEFERALGRMKRVFRAFGDIAKEIEAEPPPAAAPDRT
ncbi:MULTISPECIES: hypothetical protein [unclassified Aureimonas]|uniref:hypothetical protein n=1 Tax=unclassified Aureimonas TaxID=2615206 RepID=UPI0007007790|nr:MULTISPECIES: hypothetical protein [unclassified Aureimonas]KQT60669.1 hypothetical protein ASG54_24740 [Aureimonas sp. Leaf460]KQT68798.1 hypothetical protein ASG62_18260 [Aureimonas sp. Leaf427]